MSGNQEDSKAKRGFAAMSPERQRAIASQGGKAAHEQGAAHQWSKEEAADAGRKGGQQSAFKRKASRDDNREELL